MSRAAAAEIGERARAWESLGVGVGFLVLYAVLGQEVFYKTDGPDLMWMLRQGDLQHPWHLAYLPLLDGFRGLVGWTGTGLLGLGNLFSALGMSVGVGFFHGALCVLGMRRGKALLCALLLGLCPGCLMFGTVVEFHGPLMAVVGVAYWWTARAAMRPCVAAMLALGVLTHAAFLMHSTAVFLPVPLLGWFLALRRGRAPLADERATLSRDLFLCIASGAVHAALFLFLPKVFPGFYGDYADLAGAFARESGIGRPQGLDWAPAILWQEWLVPLAPLSFAFVPALFAKSRPPRWEGAAVLVGLLPFWFLSVRQLVFEPEYGAYMLPVLPLAARATAIVWPRPALVVLALLSAAGGTYVILDHDDPAPYRRWEQGLRQAAGGRPLYVFVATHRELTLALATLGEDEFTWVQQSLAMDRSKFTPRHLTALDEGISALRRQGRAVILTDATVAFMRDPGAVAFAESGKHAIPAADRVAGPLYLEHLRETWRLEPVRAPGFSGLEILPP